MSLLIANMMSSPVVIQLAVVGGVATIVWWLLDLLASKKPRAEQRLQDIREPNTHKSDLLRDGKNKSGTMSKMLEKASPALAKPLQPKSDQEVSDTKSKLNQAGFRAENAAEVFWSLKMIGLVGGIYLGGGAIV